MDKKWIKLITMRLAAWILLALLLPRLVETVGLIYLLAPSYYIAVCCYTFLFFESSLALLQRRGYILYLGLLLLGYTGFTHLQEILQYASINLHLDELHRLQRLRIYYVSHNIFRTVIALSIVYHLVWLRRERRQMQQAKLQAELAMLKSQIAPHFFFNSLNSIYSLTLAQSDKAPDAIITLSDMMRYVLTEAKQEWIAMEKEIIYLQHYIDLQRLRLPHMTTLDYEVSLEGDHRIPPMLLITFYENAFKYGTSSQRDETILIHLHVSEHTLHLTTHNAIVSEKSPEISTGNGIANARRRLELIYPHRYSLDIREQDGYYHLQLSIQLT